MNSIRPKQSVWGKFVRWVGQHSKISTGLAVGCTVIAAALVAVGIWWPGGTQPAATVVAKNPQQPAAPVKYYSPLTGVEVPDEATTKRQVTAIMIENSPVSRPQSGIKPAGVVFEAIAEGGITRFLTLHQENRPQLIGPVRSLRPYYIDWLAPFDAAVAHVGGSFYALKTIRNGQFKDIDQFFSGNYYWRATDRAAPHNVYTSFDKLDALNKSKGYTSSNFTAWPRKIDSPGGGASKIDITISSASYNVHYDYDAPSNSYIRSVGGQPHTDREAGQVTPKVVVVMKMPTQLGFEDGYREQMTTLGTYQALVFQDGTVTDGFWHKNDQKGQIQFYDKLGRPIRFNAGQVWVSITAPEKKVTWQ